MLPFQNLDHVPTKHSVTVARFTHRDERDHTIMLGDGLAREKCGTKICCNKIAHITNKRMPIFWLIHGHQNRDQNPYDGDPKMQDHNCQNRNTVDLYELEP
jgi:hypothetical protein